MLPPSFTLFCPNTVTGRQPLPSPVKTYDAACFNFSVWTASVQRSAALDGDVLPSNSGQVPQMWHTWLTACHWQGSLPSITEAAMATLAGCEKAASDRLDVKNNMPHDTADDTFVIYQEQPPTSPYTQCYWHFRDHRGGCQNHTTLNNFFFHNGFLRHTNEIGVKTVLCLLGYDKMVNQKNEKSKYLLSSIATVIYFKSQIFLTYL